MVKRATRPKYEARHAADLGVLYALVDALSPPCTTSKALPPSAWISDDKHTLDAAARACWSCPLREECTSYGRMYRPLAGQWGRYRHGRRLLMRRPAA